MVSHPELNSWLRQICREELAARHISCSDDGENLIFNYLGANTHLWLAAFPNPFNPDKGPPVCCLGIPARLLDLYRSEITNSDEFIGGLIDELLDELPDWN